MTKTPEQQENQNSVAEQVKYVLERNPESLGNIQFGEIVIKVRNGKCVHMDVKHAYKLDGEGD